jgi:hypothetical protein
VSQMARTSEKRLRSVVQRQPADCVGPGPSRLSGQATIAVDTAVIERAVAQLNAICKQATFDFAMAVGRLVIDTFHSGDLQAWRTRGAKDVSFRMLAKHPNLPMSPAALYRSVAIYELAQRVDVTRLRRISTSHMRLVLPLPREDQERILLLADAQAWSVGRLDKEVAAIPFGHVSSKGGRKRSSKLRKTMKVIERCLDEADNLIGAQDEEISPETARGAKDLTSRLREACRRLDDRLSQAQQDIGPSEQAAVRSLSP